MIATAAAFLVSKGVSEKVARPLLFGAGILALVGAVLLLWQCSVAGEVEQREAGQRAANVEQARAADAAAAEQARRDDTRIETERDELEGLTNADPSTLSDMDRAYLRCIRLQQSARADERPAPVC